MILLPLFSVCQTRGNDPDEAVAIGVDDHENDQILDRPNANLSGFPLVASGVDAGQNIALENEQGLLEGDLMLLWFATFFPASHS
jgi:hypothetical protein